MTELFNVSIEVDNDAGDSSTARRIGDLASALRSAIVAITDRFPHDRDMQSLGDAVRAVSTEGTRS